MSSSSPTPASPSAPTHPSAASGWGVVGAGWGLVGIALLLGSAVWRLAPIAWDAVTGPLTSLQLTLGVLWVAFMAYSEGYRGFQKAFSPRVVVRALWLRRHPRPWLILLAPMFCMGLVHATRKRLTVSWVLLTVIVAFVMAVKLTPAPWRGLIDAGVVVGLTWGLVATAAILIQAFRGQLPDTPSDVPGA